MNIETVNELIASLESAGEPSIKETKVMALAKAFKQLVAENVELKQSERELDNTCAEEFGQDWVSELTETPATDRIVAGIKADGVEEFAAYQRAITEEWACKEGHSSLLKVAESAELFAKQLREGADK